MMIRKFAWVNDKSGAGRCSGEARHDETENSKRDDHRQECIGSLKIVGLLVMPKPAKEQ